jgi:D-alanyl-D-alanine carboxypeptidase
MTSHQPFEKRVAAILLELGIPASYGSDSGLPSHREATDLLSVGADIYGRDQRLTPEVAARWQAMQAAAAQQGVRLLLVSAFRSVDDQQQIWERKPQAPSLSRGWRPPNPLPKFYGSARRRVTVSITPAEPSNLRHLDATRSPKSLRAHRSLPGWPRTPERLAFRCPIRDTIAMALFMSPGIGQLVKAAWPWSKGWHRPPRRRCTGSRSRGRGRCLSGEPRTRSRPPSLTG